MVLGNLARPLKSNQYYPQKFKKRFIWLHHTVGGTVQSTVDWWNHAPDHICTPYIIDRDGKVYEIFNPDYWAYALGVKGATSIEKASIHIELVAWGHLSRQNNKFFAGTREIPNEDVASYIRPFRGHYHYHMYTTAQIKALKELLEYLSKRYNIALKGKYDQFAEFVPNFMARQTQGVWSHTSIRQDKSDIHPQPDLISMLNGLK